MKRPATKESPYEGYFFAHDYIEADDDGKPIDRKRVYNVVGRFAGHEMVDNQATAASGKPGRVMKTVLVLFERVLKDVADQASKDEVATVVTPRNQDALADRYPEAWAAYQDSKKPRKPRQKKGDAGAEIVDLQSARG
jgi:hypothetical protein